MSDIKLAGQKIKALCEMKNISTAELAERCALSPVLLEKMMAGEYFPSIGTLVRISRCLGERLGTLLDDQQNLGPVIYRKEVTVKPLGDTDKQKAGHLDLDIYPLAASKSGRHMEPFLIHLKPSLEQEIAFSSHEGEEFIYVLEGRVQISYGNDVYVVSAGESIYYDSVVTHNVHSMDNQPATVLAVVYAPF